MVQLNDQLVGITTTVPTEVLLAAGKTPVDLNNLFITSGRTDTLISSAERAGFPKSYCAWIKGIYGTAMESDIRNVVAVIEGDCSSTRVLLDVLTSKGIKGIPFAYPYTENVEDVRSAIVNFAQTLGVSMETVEEARKQLSKIRLMVREIDRLTWETLQATGFENHLYQVSCSDYNGNVSGFEKELENALTCIRARKPMDSCLKLGYIGIPPMMGDLYDYLETHGARIVYNEVQREFAFPRFDQHRTIWGQYLDYTYPYSLQKRIKEIKKQIKIRELKGIIHYTQAFCHRSAEDIILTEVLEIPVLSISADRECVLDARTKLRLEAFVDMLKDNCGGLVP